MIEIDKEKCTNCLVCEKICVTHSMHPSENLINHKTCILCSQCQAICPEKAITHNRRLGTDFNKALSSEDFENIVIHRRSHRHFMQKKVPESVINQLIDLIHYAPTGTNSQKVHITVLASPKKIKRVSDALCRTAVVIFKFIFSPFLVPFIFLFLGKKKFSLLKHVKNEYLAKYQNGEDILTYHAPALFIFHAPTKEAPTAEQDCSIWAATGVYYAETLGLGTCFNGYLVYGLNFLKQLKRKLNIPADHKVYTTFLLGYPKYRFKRNVVRQKPNISIIK
jgi:nitroreductase/NAD-dependent dihydropyrimidine dehydrogenase PreA subunit